MQCNWVSTCDDLQELQIGVCLLAYKGSDAASADGHLEVALQLPLDGARGVKALTQKDDGVDGDEGGNAIDDVQKDLDPGHT